MIPYITAGHPSPRETRQFLSGAPGAGADLVELGVPWSDPVADGPVIQSSSHAALRAGMTLRKTLDLLAEARPATPVVVFTYLNPVLAMGAGTFAERAAEAGAAGLLVVDLPVGADPATETELQGSGLPLVRLVAPTTSGARLATVAAASRGFVYLVSRLGVTGTLTGPDSEVASRVAAVRSATGLPVAVGFGISTPAHAAAAAEVADGVVAGSAVVERMGSGGARDALRFVSDLREAVDRSRASGRR